MLQPTNVVAAASHELDSNPNHNALILENLNYMPPLDKDACTIETIIELFTPSDVFWLLLLFLLCSFAVSRSVLNNKSDGHGTIIWSSLWLVAVLDWGTTSVKEFIIKIIYR
jgi:hypothetical protein